MHVFPAATLKARSTNFKRVLETRKYDLVAEGKTVTRNESVHEYRLQEICYVCRSFDDQS